MCVKVVMAFGSKFHKNLGEREIVEEEWFIVDFLGRLFVADRVAR